MVGEQLLPLLPRFRRRLARWNTRGRRGARRVPAPVGAAYFWTRPDGPAFTAAEVAAEVQRARARDAEKWRRLRSDAT